MKTGIHTIIQKIQADAQQHSNERSTQIRNEIDEETNRENTHYCEEFDKRREILKNHNEHEYKRLLERLNSRYNRELLTYQHSLIDEIFDRAVLKLRNTLEKDFSEMLKAAVKGLNGRLTLYIGELSEGMLDSQSLEEAVKGNCGLEIVMSAETISRKSGFLLADDMVEYNYLFEDLIEDRKRERAAAIFKEVFDE